MSDDPSYDLDAGPDPANYAAATPGPACAGDHRRAVHAVGVGPGNQEYLVPRADRAIREAGVVGFATVVDLVRDRTDADCVPAATETRRPRRRHRPVGHAVLRLSALVVHRQGRDEAARFGRPVGSA